MSTNPTDHQAGRRPPPLLPILALVAIGIAGYLLYVALASKGLPLGCGGESGCAEVLTSRWSVIAGIPVSAPALLIYLTLFAAAILPSQPATRFVLYSSAVMLLGAAIWFVSLQLFVLRAVCPWCMVEHGIGVVIAGLVVMSYRSRPAGESSPTIQICGLAGAVGFALFVSAQILSSPPVTTIRLPEGANADTGPGPNRQIAVLRGKLLLEAHEEPVIGSADAPRLLCLMFDYCCPHCKRTHGYLQQALDQFPDELAIVSLAMPRDADCNPTLEQTEDRFQNACELARLSLAVWIADQSAFAEFDRWLFESDKPRSEDAARARAEQLVPVQDLEAALADPSIGKRIARNIQAFEDSDAQSIPVMMSPGFDTVVGRPESEEALLEILRKELFTGSNATP